MTTARISRRLSQQVRQRADYRCEYCQSPEWLSGQLCQIDHIRPRASGGATSTENLCLACAACNGFKLDRMAAALKMNRPLAVAARTMWLQIAANSKK